MKLYLIPITSVLLQFLAAFLALRLIWVTEKVASWMIIAGAIFLMSIRRCISLYQWLFDTVPPPPLDISFEIFGLCISALMTLGLLMISPLFHSIRRSLDLLRQQHRVILDSAGEGIFGLDLEGKVTFVNPAAASLSGYRIEELLGQNIHNMIHYAKANGFPHNVEDCPIHASLIDGEIHRVAYDVFWTKDGMSMSVEYTSTPTREKNRIIGTTVVFKDITERKKMEDELRHSEEHYRGLITNGMDMIIVLDTDGIMQYLSPSVERMLGYKAEELIGTNTFDLIHSEDVEKIHKIFEEVVQVEGAVRVGEYRIRRKDGSWCFHESLGKNLLSHAKISGIVINSRDITDRKQAEKELSESESRYRQLVELSPDTIFIQTEGKIAYINPAGVKLFGATRPEELLGFATLDLMHPDFKEIVAERIRRLRDEKTPVSRIEEKYLRLDGSEVDVEVAATPIVYQGKPGALVMAHDITERQRSMQEIEGLAKFPGENPNPVLRIARDGAILYANPTSSPLLKLWGCEAGQLLPYDLRQLISESLAANLRKELEVECGGSIFSLILTPITDLGYLNIYAADITERKRAEEKVRLNEARLQTLFNISQHDAQNIQDLLDYTLNAAIQLTGSKVGYFYHYEEESQIFVLNTWSKDVMRECSVVEPQTVYQLEKTGIWGEAVRQRQPIMVNDFKAPNPLKKGYPEGHVELSRYLTIPVFDGGKIVAVVGVANKERDYDETDVLQLSLLMDGVWKIFERQRAEEAFQVLVNQAPMGIFIVQDGKCQIINPGFEKVTGYTAQELLGRESRTMVHPDYQEMVRETAIRMLKGKLELAYEFPIITKSGETRWVIEKVTSTIYHGKRAVLGYFLDISERKSLEDQFLQAQKMEAVGRLAGGVAHDFNNMLGVIMGYCDLMSLKFHQDDPLTRPLSEIRKAADRAASLTQQLLAFSRKQILTPQVLNLNNQLGGMQKMVERLIGEDIEMAMVLDPSLAPVKADPGQIEQIVMNLIINARDAMPRGGKLTLETANVYLDESYTKNHAYATPGHYVMLAVTDNGQGMDAETQARIFEPFFTTKETGKGTGLGLSTVYGIVKQSRGHIQVYSEIGQGTTFKVYLPQVEEAVSAISKTKPMGEELRGSETVLVVEDDDMMRELICASLDMYGYKVLEARHGDEALLLCKQHPEPIHLMLTDVVMPRMSGRELADRLAPLCPDMKVLYMSGYTENAIVHHGVLDSSFPFIQKPFSPTALAEKVWKILNEVVRQV